MLAEANYTLIGKKLNVRAEKIQWQWWDIGSFKESEKIERLEKLLKQSNIHWILSASSEVNLGTREKVKGIKFMSYMREASNSILSTKCLISQHHHYAPYRSQPCQDHWNHINGLSTESLCLQSQVAHYGKIPKQ